MYKISISEHMDEKLVYTVFSSDGVDKKKKIIIDITTKSHFLFC